MQPFLPAAAYDPQLHNLRGRLCLNCIPKVNEGALAPETLVYDSGPRSTGESAGINGEAAEIVPVR